MVKTMHIIAIPPARMNQLELDALADVSWWMKGYIHGCEMANHSCEFDVNHRNTLQKAKEVLQLELNCEIDRCREEG